jgi:hypothetical protein
LLYDTDAGLGSCGSVRGRAALGDRQERLCIHSHENGISSCGRRAA